MQPSPCRECESSLQHIWLLCAILATVSSLLPTILKFIYILLLHLTSFRVILKVNVFDVFRILERIEASRRNIETELKDVLKLCRWDRVEIHWTAETSKRTRQKLKKIIQKYTVSQ